MPVIPDRPAQLLLDKIGYLWQLMFAAGQCVEDFDEVILDTGDTDVATDILDEAELTDDNFQEGLQYYNKVDDLLKALVTHVIQVGSYDAFATYMDARRYRIHEYTADRGFLDAMGLSQLARLNVCPVDTHICTHVEATGYTDIGDISAVAGPGRVRVEVDAKGAGIWQPDIYAVCEGPVTALNGAITDAVVTIPCDDTTSFPATGAILIGSEAITYTGNVANEFTGCTRGAYGTAAAAHLDNAAVVQVKTYDPAIRAAAQVGLLVDLAVALVDDISPAGGTALESTGILATGEWQAGGYILVKDHSCPQDLIADCNAAALVYVADANAFHSGDHVLIWDDTPTEEWATVLSVDRHDGLITLDAATAGNFAVADNAVIMLAYDFLNEGAVLTAVDNTITLADSTGFPGTGTVLIDDEEITYTGNALNDLTGCVRGANGTVATAHEDTLPVVLVQAGTFPGHCETGVISVVGANSLTTVQALVRSYYTAAFIVPLVKDIVLTEDGLNGTPGDDIDLVAKPDRLIHKAI